MSDTNGLTIDGPDFGHLGDALQAAARKAGEAMKASIAKLAAQLADSVRPGLQSVAHELAFRAHARTCGERVCPGLAEQHADLVGKCPTCGAAV